MENDTMDFSEKPPSGKLSSEEATTQFAHIESFTRETPDQTQKRNTAIRRKIDLHLLPFLVLMYLLNILDRTNLAQARQGSLEADLGMSGDDFNLATSIFFVAYLLMQLPSNMLLTRVRPSLYLSAAMTLWGVVSTCNAATHSFGSLIAVRFCLGFVEAPFFSGAIFLMSSWYTRAELTRRIAWFYSGNALANMFGGLLGAAVLGNLDGDMGLAGWRWLFIVEGTITIGVAIAAGFFLPDYPATTAWLSEEEKHFAIWRLRQDIDEDDEASSYSVMDGLKMALKDWRLYVFVLFQHLSLLSQTFQYFFPAIVGTLGYGAIDTLWLTAPAWVSNSPSAPRTHGFGVLTYVDIAVRNIPYFHPRHLVISPHRRPLYPHHLLDARSCSRKCHRHRHNKRWRAFLCHVLDAHGGSISM